MFLLHRTRLTLLMNVAFSQYQQLKEMIIYHVGPYSCTKQPCGISFRSNSTENNILQKQDHNVNSLKVVVIWSKYLDTQSLPCFWFQAWSCQSCWVMYVFWFPLSRMVLARCFSLGCAWEGFDAKAMQVCNKIDVSLSTYMSVAERGCPLPWGVAELRLIRTCLMLECQWPYTSLDDVAEYNLAIPVWNYNPLQCGSAWDR